MTVDQLNYPNLLCGRPYKIFISHAWNGAKSDYYGLVELLKKDISFRWSNYSVAEHNPLPTKSNPELAFELKKRIGICDVMLSVADMHVTHRKWIQHELNMAIELCVPIIGVKPWGQERTPIDLQGISREFVGWNTSTIVGAIKRVKTIGAI